MTRPLRPDDWEESMMDYVLNNLSPEEAEAFQQLLETNPELATDVRLLREVLNLLPYTLPVTVPPSSLKSAILSAAQLSQPVHLSPNRRHRLAWIGITSAAALLVLALGVDNYRLRQGLKDAQAINHVLQQPDTPIRNLRGIDNVAVGRLVVDAHHGQALVAVQNLPEPPPGKVYRLWALTEQGGAILCGQFTTNPHGTAVTPLMLPPDLPNLATSELRISLEAANAPPVPEGSIVMQKRL